MCSAFMAEALPKSARLVSQSPIFNLQFPIRRRAPVNSRAIVEPDNVLLALPGTEYVAYFPRGGTNCIKLDAGSYDVEWLCPETGRYFTQPRLTVPAGRREFAPPEHQNDDWVLHLRKMD